MNKVFTSKEYNLAIRGLNASPSYKEIQEIKNLIARQGNDITLYRGVLNDDTAYQLEDGKHCLLEVWHYANEWGNIPSYRLFGGVEELLDYYKDEYKGRVIEEGRELVDECADEGASVSTDECDAINEWVDTMACLTESWT